MSILPPLYVVAVKKEVHLSPETGLLPRGDGGANVKSSWTTGLQFWGDELNAGKCCRFSNPICTSGSEGGQVVCEHMMAQPKHIWITSMQNISHLSHNIPKWIKNNGSSYLHFPCFRFSSSSMRLSLRFSSLAFFCLRRFLFSRSSNNKKNM